MCKTGFTNWFKWKIKSPTLRSVCCVSVSAFTLSVWWCPVCNQRQLELDEKLWLNGTKNRLTSFTSKTASELQKEKYSKLAYNTWRHLVSIQINDHRLLDAFNLIEQEPDCKRDVGVDAEAAAMVGTTVMKATTNVDCPTSLHRKPRRLSSNSHTHKHGLSNTIWYSYKFENQMLQSTVNPMGT